MFVFTNRRSPVVNHRSVGGGVSTPRARTPYGVVSLGESGVGVALMQALARVKRTSRNKQDGLLVGYAPLPDKLYEALAEYIARDQNTKPVDRDIEDAVAKVQDLLAVIGDEFLSGYDWRAPPGRQGPEDRPERDSRCVPVAACPRNPWQPGRRRRAEPVRALPPHLGAARPHVRDLLRPQGHVEFPAQAFFEEIWLMMARNDTGDRRREARPSRPTSSCARFHRKDVGAREPDLARPKPVLAMADAPRIG